MATVDALPRPAVEAVAGPADDHLAWLIAQVSGNRFMPLPPPELNFIGDGDYRAIGGEFLGHFVRLGGLRPDDRVLDIGCGVGRMAIPLTQYLSPEGSYDGIDVVAAGVAWCRETITARYPAFRFRHLDRHHPIYNPEGAEPDLQRRLPYDSGAFSFIIATSVLTHLLHADMAAYVREMGRLLAPGGRCFVSLFLMNPRAREALRQGTAVALPFDPAAAGPDVVLDTDHPTAAVAFAEEVLLDTFAAAGLRRIRPIVYGRWCGRDADNFQDLCVFGKPT